MKGHRFSAAILLCGTALPGAAFAQVPAASEVAAPPTGATTDDGHLQDIVVTAQRRSENLQSVPIAVTAFTAAQLGQAGISTTQDLSVATPGLSIGATAGYLQPRIRGIGTSAAGAGIENPVAVYVDGVYYASAPASLFALGGVERVEVLKGPQGTLFGRNATGGLVQIVTKDPGSHPEAELNVGYGNYGIFTGDAYVAAPLSEDVGASLTIHGSHQRNGFGTNTATGADTNKLNRDIATRAKLVGNFGDLKVTLSADYNELSGSYQAGRLPPGETSAVGNLGQPTQSPYDINTDVVPLRDFKGGGASLRAEVPVGFARIVSITAYRRSQFLAQFDYDQTPIPVAAIRINQADRQFSQELQLTSNTGSHISWVVGGYYFDARSAFNPVTVSFFGVPTGGLSLITTDGIQKTQSVAGFAQVTVPLGDRTNLTGGLRYTSERRDLNGQQIGTFADVGDAPLGQHVVASKRFNKLTFRAALDHKLTDTALGYVSFNRGFKSGGFNPQLPADPAYRPEVLDDYEAGIKADLFDKHLRLDVAGFYYDYSDIQVAYYTSSGQSGIRNGAKAKVYGLDLDATAVVTADLRFTGGLSIIHDRFTDFPNAIFDYPLPTGGSLQNPNGNARGNRIPITPDWTVNVGAAYTIHLAERGRIEVDANYFHSDGYFTESDNLRRQRAYDQVNASITWHNASDRLTIGAFGRNLTDKGVALQIVGAQIAGNATYAPPRTYGVTVGMRY